MTSSCDLDQWSKYAYAVNDELNTDEILTNCVTWGLLQYKIPLQKPVLNLNLAKSHLLITYSQLPNPDDIFSKTRLWYWRVLCKFSKPLEDWNRCYGRMRFCEILVWGKFVGEGCAISQQPAVPVCGFPGDSHNKWVTWYAVVMRLTCFVQIPPQQLLCSFNTNTCNQVPL